MAFRSMVCSLLGGVWCIAYFGDCDRLFRDNPITSVSHL